MKEVVLEEVVEETEEEEEGLEKENETIHVTSVVKEAILLEIAEENPQEDLLVVVVDLIVADPLDTVQEETAQDAVDPRATAEVALEAEAQRKEAQKEADLEAQPRRRGEAEADPEAHIRREVLQRVLMQRRIEQDPRVPEKTLKLEKNLRAKFHLSIESQATTSERYEYH